MSTRCKGCDSKLSRSDAVIINRLSKLEEDLCATCRHMAKHASPEREYVCGANPVTGATLPKTGES